MKLQMIGGGRMAEALLGGLVGRGWGTVGELHVVEPAAERRALLSAEYPLMSIGTEPVADTDALIAVKPDVVAAVLDGLAAAGVTRVLSIAAGVRTEVIERQLPAGTAVVRCMPNTPALIGKGAAAIARGAAAGPDDLDWAAGIMGAVGTVELVDESDLDAVTGLSGSGPAYLFCLAEALTAAGIAQGLAPETADSLTRQTLFGAAALLSESGEDPAVLRRNVTSPEGTTAAGLAVLAEADLVALMGRVVQAATQRSRELGS